MFSRAGQTANIRARRADNKERTTITTHPAAATKERSPTAQKTESHRRSTQAQANRNKDNEGKQEMHGKNNEGQLTGGRRGHAASEVPR